LHTLPIILFAMSFAALVFLSILRGQQARSFGRALMDLEGNDPDKAGSISLRIVLAMFGLAMSNDFELHAHKSHDSDTCPSPKLDPAHI